MISDNEDNDVENEDDPIFLEKSLYLTRIYDEAWLPSIKNYIMNQWNPKDFEGLIDYLLKWKPLIPQNITEKLNDLFVVPTLQKAIEKW